MDGQETPLGGVKPGKEKRTRGLIRQGDQTDKLEIITGGPWGVKN